MKIRSNAILQAMTRNYPALRYDLRHTTQKRRWWRMGVAVRAKAKGRAWCHGTADAL
jgi:hypothetical protein